MNRQLWIPMVVLWVLAAPPALAQQETPETRPSAARRAPEAPQPDPAVEAWVQTLVRRIADAHPGIRRSAREGLVALGRPALPALHRHADAGDPVVAAAARELIGRIEQGRRGRRPEGEAPAPPRERQSPLARLTAELGLSEDQKRRLRESMEAGARKRRELFQDMRDGTLSREELRAALRELQKKNRTTLEGLLTEGQLEEYRRATERGRRGGGRRRPDRSGGL